MKSPLVSLLLLPALFAAEHVFADGQPPARVVTRPVHLEQYQERARLVGEVDFDRVALLSPEVSGVVESHDITAGRQVKAGELLLSINTDLRRKDIDIQQREKGQLIAEKKKVSASLKRLEKLMTRDSASRQAYEDALYDDQALTARQAALDERIAKLKIELDKSHIHAPFDGIILEKLKERGDWIAPGDPAARLASIDDVIVRVAIPESLLRFQQPGSEVNVWIEALNQSLSGRIETLVPVAESRSRSLPLKIRIPYRAGLASGLSAEVELPAADSRELLRIPRDALLGSQGNTSVFTLEENKAVSLPVQVVAREGDQVMLEPGGLKDGMPVVVDGNDRLRPGQAVQVVKPE